MNHLALDEVDIANRPRALNSVRKPLSAALGTTDFAMVYFELEPDESFSPGLHTHHDVEEVFYILEGTATFMVGKDRERIEVREGEVICFAPGEFQRGVNDSDERVVSLIISAPGAAHDNDELEYVFECRNCGEERSHQVEPVESES